MSLFKRHKVVVCPHCGAKDFVVEHTYRGTSGIALSVASRGSAVSSFSMAGGQPIVAPIPSVEFSEENLLAGESLARCKACDRKFIVRGKA